MDLGLGEADQSVHFGPERIRERVVGIGSESAVSHPGLGDSLAGLERPPAKRFRVQVADAIPAFAAEFGLIDA